MHKIKRGQIYFILLLALFAQLTVLNYVEIFGAKPDLVLVCVVFFGLFLGSSAGLEAGIAAGLFTDIFALDFFGINIFIYGLTGLAAGLLNTKVFKESKRAEFTIVFFFTALSMSLHFAVASAISPFLGLPFRDYFYNSILPASLYTAFAAIPIFLKFIEMYKLKELQGLL